jgi:ABC-type multidrug transport system permease subunit
MTKTVKGFIITFIAGMIFYFSVGFFVIQPIGAVPDGVTIMYFRIGLNVSFISSPDGILIDKNQDVSLLARMMIMGKFGEIVNERKIGRLPYSQTMYLISTGGKEFDR